MEKIQSFTVDHTVLTPGMYVSRIDHGIITYDLRTRRPNHDDYMDFSTMHTLEHMFATYIRNSDIKDNVIYFGPMGCQTGFYLLVKDEAPIKVFEVVKQTLDCVINHTGEVFGNSEIECGNFKTLNLEKAKAECKMYKTVLDNFKNMEFSY